MTCTNTYWNRYLYQFGIRICNDSVRAVSERINGGCLRALSERTTCTTYLYILKSLWIRRRNKMLRWCLSVSACESSRAGLSERSCWILSERSCWIRTVRSEGCYWQARFVLSGIIVISIGYTCNYELVQRQPELFGAHFCILIFEADY